MYQGYFLQNFENLENLSSALPCMVRKGPPPPVPALLFFFSVFAQGPDPETMRKDIAPRSGTRIHAFKVALRRLRPHSAVFSRHSYPPLAQCYAESSHHSTPPNPESHDSTVTAGPAMHGVSAVAVRSRPAGGCVHAEQRVE